MTKIYGSYRTFVGTLSRRLLASGLLGLVALVSVLFNLRSALAAPTDGPLSIEIITAYNFVVDSNIGPTAR